MAIEYITQSTASSNTHGQQGVGASRDLRNVVDRMKGLKLTMEAMVDDPAAPTNFTTLETAFGLAAGDGTKLYTLVKDAFSVVDAPAIKKFTSRVG